jgi:hypothetical protein
LPPLPESARGARRAFAFALNAIFGVFERENLIKFLGTSRTGPARKYFTTDLQIFFFDGVTVRIINMEQKVENKGFVEAYYST